MDSFLILILFAIFLVAMLYASVGHGGASGYIAIMALASMAPDSIKPTALLLNIMVSMISFVSYFRAGYFNHKLFLPLVIASVPMAFIGGLTKIDDHIYKILLGALLIIPAIRFAGFFNTKQEEVDHRAPIIGLLLSGAVIGYLSGLTGIGGGILLSPLLLLLHWSNMKQTAALSAGFIFLNSISGLSGMMTKGITFNEQMILFSIVAFAGGMIGARMGALKFKAPILSKILGLVLFIASLKLLLT